MYIGGGEKDTGSISMSIVSGCAWFVNGAWSLLGIESLL